MELELQFKETPRKRIPENCQIDYAFGTTVGQHLQKKLLRGLTPTEETITCNQSIARNSET